MLHSLKFLLPLDVSQSEAKKTASFACGMSTPSVLWCLWNENKMSARRLWLSYVLRGICALPVLWSSFKFALMSRETKAFLVFVFYALCVLSQNFAGKETLIAVKSRVSTVRTIYRSIRQSGLTMRFLVLRLHTWYFTGLIWNYAI